MKLLTKDIEAKLRANAKLDDKDKADLKPVVKLFTPDGGATWLLSELDDDNVFFGLCDLGLGFPELGCVALDELTALRGKLGLPVERDRHWTAKASLATYAAAAQDRIVYDDRSLDQAKAKLEMA